MTSEQDRSGLHGVVFGSAVALCWSFPATSRWPLLWIAPLAAYLIVVVFVPLLRRSFRAWRFGDVTFKSAMATLALAALSCGVLVAFHWLFRPDLSRFAGRLPVAAMGGVISAGIIFSLANAAFEEIFFRGIIFDAIQPTWGTTTAVLATALIFGYGHIEGYPPGIVGATLAALYGLALGVLRAFTGGIGLGFLAHVAADATIYSLIAHENAW